MLLCLKRCLIDCCALLSWQSPTQSLKKVKNGHAQRDMLLKTHATLKQSACTEGVDHDIPRLEAAKPRPCIQQGILDLHKILPVKACKGVRIVLEMSYLQSSQ